MAPPYSRSCKRDTSWSGSQLHAGISCSLPLYQTLSDRRRVRKPPRRTQFRQSGQLANTQLLLSVLKSFAHNSSTSKLLAPIAHPRHGIASRKVNRSMHRSENRSISSQRIYQTDSSHYSDTAASSLLTSRTTMKIDNSNAMELTKDTMSSSQATTPILQSPAPSRTSDDESTSQSSLSSVPSEIGSTPEGLNGGGLDCTAKRNGSPVSRRSRWVRKQSTRAIESENEIADGCTTQVKRRKVSSTKFIPSGTNRSSGQLGSSRSSPQTPDNTNARLQKLGPSAVRSSMSSLDNEQWPESRARDEVRYSNILTLTSPASSRNHIDPSNEADVIQSFLGKVAHRNYQTRDPGIKIAAASGAEKGSNNGSAAPSPSEKAGRSNNAGKPAKGQTKLGRGKGRNGGNGGGKDRESPEPNEKTVKTTSDQVLLKSIRQRQLELKRWFAIIGIQQMEALEIMSSRDLSKLHKKPTAHVKVPEYEQLLSSLQSKQVDTRSLIDREYRMRQDLAIRSLAAQKEIIESAFLNRIGQAKVEHLKGAEGDLMILQAAHKMQIDETRTDIGSEGATNLPLYHELPEPNARIRGYSSTRIDDEKPFKEHLASYDEQAQREVIDDDIVAPVMQLAAKQNAERTAEAERRSREKMDQLATISESELTRINSYRISRPAHANANPQFNLSRLADCADLMREREREREREKAYTSISEAPKAISRRPSEPLSRFAGPASAPNMFQQPQPNPAPSTRPKSPAPRRKKSSLSAPSRRMTKEDEAQSQSSSSTSTPLPNIAPAPPKMPPPPASSQHHYHHISQHGMLPPHSSSAVAPHHARHSTLAPLIIPKTSSTPPGTPIHSQGYPQSSHLPPPPSPYQPRPSPITSTFPSQSPVPRPIQSYPPVSHPAPLPPFSPQQPRLQSFDQPRRHSPIEQLPLPPPSLQPIQSPQLSAPSQASPNSAQLQAPRFALNNSVSPHISRILGQRRGSGQITFTPTQTPSSERFTRPPGPAPQLPGRSVIRPAQLGNGASMHNRSHSAQTVGPEARAQSAADIARQNAVKNQVQGAGPKGGRRVLLPKSLG